ncbi:MAG: hypothetical protein ABIS01_04700, partial [Ferruginibacter sp.]
MMLPSDNELDKLIKEAAEQFEAGNAVPDWKGMESLLDKKLPVKKDPSRKPVIILLFLLLFTFIVASYFYLINSKPGNVAVQMAKKEIAEAKAKPATPSIDKNKSTDSEKTTEWKTSSDVPEQTGFASSQKRHPFAKHNASITRKTGYSKLNTSAGEIVENSLTVDQENATLPTETTSSVIKTPVLTNGQIEKKIEIVIDNDLKKPVQATGIENIQPIDTTRSSPDKKMQSKFKKNPFTISLLYAPELTTINLSNIDKPGSNYGILVGYDLSKKFSIQTGIIKSRKNYTANGYDYKTNYPAPPSYTLSNVAGYCNMYEIPLNLTYQLSHGKKINTYVIGGVSSYFMTNESYNFLYTSATN